MLKCGHRVEQPTTGSRTLLVAIWSQLLFGVHKSLPLINQQCQPLLRHTQ